MQVANFSRITSIQNLNAGIYESNYGLLFTVVRYALKKNGKVYSQTNAKCFLRGSGLIGYQNFLTFNYFLILKIEQYVCRNLCENFRHIEQKMKKL